MLAMNRPALFVSDLDGTLLQPDGTLSSFSREELCAFHREGIPFTVASGRAFSSIRRALGKATVGLPMISSDGAMISEFGSPKPLFLFGMDRKELMRLHHELKSSGFWPVLDIWDGRENFLSSDGPNTAAMEWYHHHKQAEEFYRWRFEPFGVLPDAWSVISLTLLDTPERLLGLRGLVEERFGQVFRTDYALMNELEGGAALWIQHRLARKENALVELTRLLNLGPSPVVVFGDELNDLGMFGREWHAVAVENARPELKAKAREVIGHHSDDPVPRHVRRMLKLDWKVGME